MKVELIFVGKTSDPASKTGVDEYIKRIKNYIPVTVTIINPSANKNTAKAISEESASILEKLKSSDFVVLLDENGQQFSSREFAVMFNKWMVRSISRVVFITGGAFGVSDDLKKKSHQIMSLSKMTFTHQMVRMILAEQIYRAMTILRNENYHHD